MEDGALITLRGKTGWREVEVARGSSDQTCPVHALTQWLHYARIDFVVLGMCAYKLDVGNLHAIGKGDDEPIFVACNVEDNSVVSNNAGVSVLRFDLCGCFPLGAADLSVPSFQRLL